METAGPSDLVGADLPHKFHWNFHWRLHFPCSAAISVAMDSDMVDSAGSLVGGPVDVLPGPNWLGRPAPPFLLLSKNSMTSHHSACSTVRFTYSKDWCFCLMWSLMASASAWTEAFACQQIHYAKAAARFGGLSKSKVSAASGRGKKSKTGLGPAQHQLGIHGSTPAKVSEDAALRKK